MGRSQEAGKNGAEFSYDNWQERARSVEEMRHLMRAFSESHGFDLERTPFERLGGLRVKPEMLVLRDGEPLGGTLNALGILRHLVLGHIVIEPFNPDLVGVNSADVTIHSDYFYTH